MPDRHLVRPLLVVVPADHPIETHRQVSLTCPVSDAFVVGEDWISEHYFTTDAKSESFQGKVLERRKAWDATEVATTQVPLHGAARGDLERGLHAPSRRRTPTATASASGRPTERATMSELCDRLLDVLGYRTGEFAHRDEGPLTWVSSPADRPAAAGDRLRAARRRRSTMSSPRTPTPLVPFIDRGRHEYQVRRAGCRALFVRDDGPAFALVLAGRWALIAEQERWPEGRYLAVDLQLVCERNDTKRGGEIDRALTCLDAAVPGPRRGRRHLVDDRPRGLGQAHRRRLEGPSRGRPPLDRDHRQRGRHPPCRAGPRAAAGRPGAAAGHAVLRYLYRILFLLYAEASPELGVLPTGASEYEQGLQPRPAP